MLAGVTHVRTQLGKITPAVEAVFGGDQECGCQKVLSSTAGLSWVGDFVDTRLDAPHEV